MPSFVNSVDQDKLSSDVHPQYNSILIIKLHHLINWQ